MVWKLTLEAEFRDKSEAQSMNDGIQVLIKEGSLPAPKKIFMGLKETEPIFRRE